MVIRLMQVVLTLCLAGLTFAAEPAAAPNSASPETIRRIETGLLPPARISGGKSETWSIADRLAFHQVPGVSIAVIADCQIVWARGYGLARAGETTKVDPETLFQAASISKPVAAAGALTLVDAGLLSLDQEVNEKLTSWKIPPAAATARQPVTLRTLLAHTAGLSVHGFRGYTVTERIPTLLEILDGRAPANSLAIRVVNVPGTQWRYSAGGYTVVQQLLEDITGESFPALMKKRVLLPAGMTASTFEQPLPAARKAHAAAGHQSDGTRIEGDAYVHPEMAAAGLWTTPGDLARFSLGLTKSLRREPGPLSAEMATAMISPPLAGSDYGLGVGVQGAGPQLMLTHNGSNVGFRCVWVLYPQTGKGAVVMTNSDQGGALANEILRAIAEEYQWPHYRIIEKPAAVLSPLAFDDFVGRYRREETLLTLFRIDGRFYFKRDSAPRIEIFPQSDHEFFFLDRQDTLSLQRNADGEVTHLIRRSPSAQIFQRVR